MKVVTSESSLFCCFVSADDEEDTLPDDLDDNSPKSRSIPHTPAATPTSLFARGRKTDNSLYHMSTMLAAVAMGFDIGIANTRAIHPYLHCPSAEEERGMKKRDSYINNRRDAYLAAVRDAFIEPEGDFRSYQAPPPGYWHTYHGVQARQRPSLNLDYESLSPAFTQADSDFSNQAGAVTFNLNAHTTSHRSSLAESEASTSTPTTEHTVIFNRHLPLDNTLDSSSPKPAGQDAKNKPQRRSVTFEDDFGQADLSKLSGSVAAGSSSYMYNSTHKRTPSNTSTSSGVLDQQDSHQTFSTNFMPSALNSPDHTSLQQPVPPRRRPGAEPAQRPTSLDVGGPGSSTPVHIRYPSSPGYGQVRSGRAQGGEDPLPYVTTRSHLSPGNTPPHIAHQKTLLDIDVEGQNQDATRPLVQHNTASVVPMLDLGNEFCSKF